MKIKTIDELSLDECQQLIAENPTSSNISEVIKRKNFLLMNRDNDRTDLEYEAFLVKYRRLDVLQNYHDAFLLVLSTIRSSMTNRQEDIRALGIKMLETNARRIWKWSSFWGYGELQLDFDYGCSSDWLIDRAIEAQFTKVKTQNKRIIIGSFPGLSWHSYFLANKDANCSLRYSHAGFAKKQDIDKMLNIIGKRLIDEAIRCSRN